MAVRQNWDFALHIKGVSLKTLDMARLAEYIKEFAALMGEGASPKFAGIVKGSVVLRARDCNEHMGLTRQRLLSAVNDEAPGHSAYQKIENLMRKDGTRGDIIDSQKSVILSFDSRKAANDDVREIIIHDNGEIDGTVVGIAGADDTAHVRLQVHGGKVETVTVRDMALARELATRFRLGPVRVYVHGTWKRTKEGVWEPNRVYADRIEDLDSDSVHDVFRELATIPGNGWSEVKDADELWKKIRGLDDSSP